MPATRGCAGRKAARPEPQRVETEGVVGGLKPEGKQKALPVLIEHGRDGWLSERLMRYELDLKLTGRLYQSLPEITTQISKSLAFSANRTYDRYGSRIG